MTSQEIFLGQDFKDFMDQNDISPEQIARQLNCSIQTIYAWRSNRYSKIQIPEKHVKQISKIFESLNWENQYKTELRNFITERARSVVFWTFHKNAGIDEETFVPPMFRRINSEKEISFETILFDWNTPYNTPKLIVGPSGYGKTTFIRWGILKALDQNCEFIPIVVPLGLYAMWEKTPDSQNAEFRDFLGFVFQTISITQEYALKVFERIISGRAILFLDGLDEIPPDLHDHFILLIKQLQIEIKTSSKIILTSRTLSFAIHALLRSFFTTYQILPFSGPQISQLSNQFLSTKDALSFLKAIQEYPSLRDLSSLPLTLSIMLAVFKTTIALEFTEAAVIEFLVDFAFGKYKGARSLGGYIERENSLTYLDSPASIRNVVYQSCFEIRKKQPFGTVFHIDDFRDSVYLTWQMGNFVPKNAYKPEFDALLNYLIQLGFVSITYVADSQYASTKFITFPSELIVDWFTGAHLAQDQVSREKVIENFIKEPVMISASMRRQMIYALELMNSNYGNLSLVNNTLTRIYEKCCTTGINGIDRLLNTRFLFLVDCLNLGLISNFKLKRDIRISFRKRFESNDYALIQKELQFRRSILEHGTELNLEEEKEYVNPFNRESLKKILNDEDYLIWRNDLLNKRFYDVENAQSKYKDVEDFMIDMEWRYDPNLEYFINHIAPQLIALNPHHPFNEVKLRRQIFAIRFISLESFSPDQVKVCLNLLLKIAIYQSRQGGQKGDIYKYMALDSFWYLFKQVSDLVSFWTEHPFSKIDLTELRDTYFKTAKNHLYFIKEYCNNKDLNINKLLDDSVADAHYILIEHERISEAIKSPISLSSRKIYIQEILDFTQKLVMVKDNMNNAQINFPYLNRIAKLCIYLAINTSKVEDKNELIKIFTDLARVKDQKQHKLNIGPRQLYDYAIFGIWSLCEYENPNNEILPF